MKTIPLAVSFVAAGVVSASAADLAARPYTKAQPMLAAAYDWSGFYVGANGGGASSQKCWDVNPFIIDTAGLIPTFTVSGSEGCHTASGATAGGQFGYRWQRAAWVFGLEAQGNWADMKGSNLSQLSLFADNGVANRTRIDAIGLFTGQVGYAWDRLLLYVKGGAAVTSDKYDSFLATAFTQTVPATPAGFIVSRGSETRWGGAIGIGGEYSFSPDWSFALEYDHLLMGDGNVAISYDPAFFNPTLLNHSERIHQDVDMFTARVNYRFGTPMVAKY